MKRNVFLAKLTQYLKTNKFKHEYLFAAGYDYYYSNAEGRAPRHRIGGMTNELTIKSRISSKSIQVRKEINVPLAPEASPDDVCALMKLMGFKRILPIYKTCDIFFIKDGRASVDIVWYKITRSKAAPRVFVEVEIGGLPMNQSKKLLKKWAILMENMCNLKPDERSFDSLYEIYTGRKYRKD